MRLVEKGILIKLKNKNRGNTKLTNAVDRLISDFEESGDISPDNLHQLRKDADKIHSDGIYFFNIHIHRVMLLIEFSQNRATVLWAGSHD
ncbi:type II toxin-antitoxin system HigB family toxin [Dyadobacter bucti]|uniref:type II toxin-antitoxin system HigB family toxin n=1 Tax=Dyadobacter bucti TaxID=2572203 RepID=UPI003F6E8513